MNHIQPSEIWPQIKDVWVMCSLSKLRVSHTVIPYSFPCCIPLSEIGMDLSSGLFCAGCQRSDNGINRILGWSVAGIKCMTSWWLVTVLCMLCVCCVYVVCMLKTGNPSPVLKNKRVFLFVYVVYVFSSSTNTIARACACVYARVI